MGLYGYTRFQLSQTSSNGISKGERLDHVIAGDFIETGNQTRIRNLWYIFCRLEKKRSDLIKLKVKVQIKMC